MARKKIRECTAKGLLKFHSKTLPKSFAAVQATKETDWEALVQENPWLATSRLVVKPDMLFGQRGKHDLLGLNLTLEDAKKFVADRVGKVITVGGDHHGKPGVTGAVSTFIVERFVPHTSEYYCSFSAVRDGCAVVVSSQGGVDIEANWGAAKHFEIPIGKGFALPAEIVAEFPEEHRGPVSAFLADAFRIFEELDFTFMEFNPFTIIAAEDGKGLVAVPLDMRGELDDTAAFKNARKWCGLETFPQVFGHASSPAEDLVSAMDASTGASLKLTILNPAGRVWLLVAGGGASVIYTDTVCDLGHSAILGNYGEYSGNPTDEYTFQYTKVVLEAATRLDAVNPTKGRALLIGGGIANFTDVKATFKGICEALMEFGEQLQACDMKIFVRRGGPNFEAALQMMKSIENALGVPVEVFGPDTHMTRIVHLASDYVASYDKGETEKTSDGAAYCDSPKVGKGSAGEWATE